MKYRTLQMMKEAHRLSTTLIILKIIMNINKLCGTKGTKNLIIKIVHCVQETEDNLHILFGGPGVCVNRRIQVFSDVYHPLCLLQ